MKKFTTVCIDKETNLEIIASDCSFNEACMFLETENSDERFGKFVSAKGMIGKSYNFVEMKFEKAEFLYDETRGLLLIT